MNELLRKPAREVVRLLERREVSPVELAELALARIAAVDGSVNAVPTVCAERALEHARRLGDAAPPDDRRGWLGGLPVVIKDLNDVAGVRTTYGSPIFKDHVPDRSS
jgi:amidase